MLRPFHDVLVPLRGCDGVKDLMLRLQLTKYDISAGEMKESEEKCEEKVARKRAERDPLQTVDTVRTLWEHL